MQAEVTKSYKNLLQEYFQKRGLGLPVYETESHGEPHDRKFASVVTLCDGTKHGGCSSNRKKRAEESAAEYAYDSLLDFGFSSLKTYEITTNKHVGIFVDCENQPKFINEFGKHVYCTSRRLKIYAFATKGHPSLKKIHDPEKIIIHTVKSSRSDASDLYITMMIAECLFGGYFSHYIIVTSDHFGDSLKDCIKSREKKLFETGFSRTHENTKVKVSVSIEEIVDFINE